MLGAGPAQDVGLCPQPVKPRRAHAVGVATVASGPLQALKPRPEATQAAASECPQGAAASDSLPAASRAGQLWFSTRYQRRGISGEELLAHAQAPRGHWRPAYRRLFKNMQVVLGPTDSEATVAAGEDKRLAGPAMPPTQIRCTLTRR